MKEELEAVMVAWALQSEANTKQLLSDPNGTFEQLMGVKLPPKVEVKAVMEGPEVALVLPPEEELEKMAAIFVGEDTTWPDYWCLRGRGRGSCQSVMDFGSAVAIAVCKCEKCKTLSYKCDLKCKIL